MPYVLYASPGQIGVPVSKRSSSSPLIGFSVDRTSISLVVGRPVPRRGRVGACSGRASFASSPARTTAATVSSAVRSTTCGGKLCARDCERRANERRRSPGRRCAGRAGGSTLAAHFPARFRRASMDGAARLGCTPGRRCSPRSGGVRRVRAPRSGSTWISRVEPVRSGGSPRAVPSTGSSPSVLRVAPRFDGKE